jgi:flagellar protein FlbD
MITLHRLGHATEELHVNHDLILSVEANPDTVISLTGGDKIVVAESPREVIDKVRECRIEILTGAMLCRDAELASGAGRVGQVTRIGPRRGLTALDPPPLSPVA